MVEVTFFTTVGVPTVETRLAAAEVAVPVFDGVVVVLEAAVAVLEAMDEVVFAAAGDVVVVRAAVVPVAGFAPITDVRFEAALVVVLEVPTAGLKVEAEKRIEELDAELAEREKQLTAAQFRLNTSNLAATSGEPVIVGDEELKLQLQQANSEVQDLRIKLDTLSNIRQREIEQLKNDFEEEMTAKETEFQEAVEADEAEYVSQLNTLREQNEAAQMQNEMQKEQIMSLTMAAQELSQENEQLRLQLEALRKQAE